jgi:cytochrome c-type biogenesis protein CcmH
MNIMRKSYLILLTVLFLLSLFYSVSYAERLDRALFKKIEANLMCTDGCGMYLKTCENATAQKMRRDIISMLTKGMSEKEIYGRMISIYGEEVMAAPPVSSKFNIIAWAGPFVAIIIGFIVIYLCLDRWIFNSRKKEAGTDINEKEIEQYEDYLDEEIKKHY